MLLFIYYFIVALHTHAGTYTDTLSVWVWKRTGGECSAALVKVYIYIAIDILISIEFFV